MFHRAIARIFGLAIIALPLTSQAGTISCNLKTDTNTYSVPNIAKPAYLGSYVDPVFGSTITRISGDPGTAISGGGTWGDTVHHQYSKVQAWNADQSLLFIETNTGPGGTGSVFLDGQTYQPRFSRPCPGSECRWHPTIANRMVYAGTNQVGYWDPTTNTTSVVATFAGYSGLTIGSFEGNLSLDGNLIVLMGTNSAGASVAFAYNLSTLTKYPDLNFTALGLSVDNASISPKGNYIVVNTLTDFIYVYNLNGTLVTQTTNYGRPSHFDLNVDAAGNEVAIGVSKSTADAGKVIKFRLSDGSVTPLTTGAYASHSSTRALQLGAWGVSDYDYNPTNPPYISEIVTYSLDGSSVYRVAHHHANVSDYDAEVHASPSPDGKRVIFASNWGATSRPVQVYVADIRSLCSSNLVTNPGFENGMANWSTWGNSVITSVACNSGAMCLQAGIGNGGVYQDVTANLAIGKSYTLAGFAKLGNATDQTGMIGIEFFDRLGNVIADYPLNTTTTAYQRYSTSVTVPAAMTSALVYVWKSVGSSYVFADDFSLSPNP